MNNMYRCVNDFHKLVICNQLPRGPAELIIDTLEDELTKDVRTKKRAVLDELVTNQRVVYLKLVHETFDRFQNHHNVILERSDEYMNNMDDMDDMDDMLTSIYLRYIAFDIKIY
jgi:hypothetical protein